jgi:hypothetical protein
VGVVDGSCMIHGWGVARSYSTMQIPGRARASNVILAAFRESSDWTETRVAGTLPLQLSFIQIPVSLG